VDEDEENETSNDTVGDVVWMSVVSVAQSDKHVQVKGMRARATNAGMASPA
jgi:hypothetical protein